MNETYRFYNGLLDNEKFICSCDIDDLMGEPMVGTWLNCLSMPTLAIKTYISLNSVLSTMTALNIFVNCIIGRINLWQLI